MHDFKMQLEKEFNKMINSVEKYGGFYIGRYETGNLGKTKAVVRKGNTDINNQTWHIMYKKCKELEIENTNVKTGMIWGNQWDRTLMWLMECNTQNIETGKSKEEVIRDATSWGNFKNVTFEYEDTNGGTLSKDSDSSIKIPTGSTEYTKANNIYDLAGNIWDWTMEGGNYYRASRGGDYETNIYGATTRSSGNPRYGCRAMLYIK